MFVCSALFGWLCPLLVNYYFLVLVVVGSVLLLSVLSFFVWVAVKEFKLPF